MNSTKENIKKDKHVMIENIGSLAPYKLKNGFCTFEINVFKNTFSKTILFGKFRHCGSKRLLPVCLRKQESKNI